MSRFYVYELADPRTGIAFYVGKGQKSRVQQHETEAAKGVYSRKCQRIRDIWSASLDVERRIVSRHADENEALQAEFDLIAAYGLDQLTNVMPGGVMGAQVYLAHLGDAEKRKEAKDRADLQGGFVKIAPQMAMVLRERSRGGQVGAWVSGRWLDFTEAFYRLFETMLDHLGFEFVAKALAPHGVELTEAT